MRHVLDSEQGALKNVSYLKTSYRRDTLKQITVRKIRDQVHRRKTKCSVRKTSRVRCVFAVRPWGSGGVTVMRLGPPPTTRPRPFSAVDGRT
jgi:hypothetical protein